MYMMSIRKWSPLFFVLACGGSQKQAVQASAPPQPVSPAPALPNPVQRPSERLGPSPQQQTMLVGDKRYLVGSHFVATLDEAVGPQFTREGQMVTATVVGGAGEPGTPLMPVGTKIHMRARMVEAAMSGTVGVVYLVPRAIEYNHIVYPLHARIVGVQLKERETGGRPAGATGSDVAGSILKRGDLSPADRERDLPGRGTAIAVGSTTPDAQLAKGTALELELRGPIPLALWEPSASSEVAIGWIRDLIGALDEENDALLGRRVAITNAPVQSVIGDVVFWVGPSKERRMLIVMDKESLDVPETKTVVTTGATVNVEGVVEAMPSKDIAPELWSMVTAKEAAEFAPHPIYIYATKVKVIAGEPTAPTKVKIKPRRHGHK
jgi:hypothetical protein